jgi:hypothetical protein
LCPWCVGAALGVAEGWVVSKITGQDYTWKDAATDAALGAVGAGLVDKLNDLRKAAKTADKLEDASSRTRGLRRELDTHRKKLEDYRANPDAHDNKGFLKNAPTPEARERIISGRIRNLENQIRTFERDIAAIENAKP